MKKIKLINMLKEWRVVCFTPMAHYDFELKKLGFAFLFWSLEIYFKSEEDDNEEY